jgi:hypothetical protein
LKPQPILKFWRNVEIFNLPDFNKNTNLINPGNPLPWLQPNKPLKKNYKWRYTLVFGKIKKKVVVDHLNSLVKIDDTNDWEEPVNGFTCLSALILDEEGIPHQDSYVTASYTFGIRALEQKTDLSLVSYDLEQSQSNFLDRYNFKWIEIAGKEVYKGDVVLWEHLHKEIEYLKGINTWWKHTIGIYVLAEIVPKDSEMNIGFLNSFYLDDLNYLSNTEEKKLGNALRAYLKLAPPVEKRKDLIQNKEFLVDSFNPNSITSGRWPSHIEYGLYSAQMGAVNSIFSNLRNNEGLQGLNGPPGTGKTTLLKDIIAEIIVERAKIISDLGCDHLFKKGYTKIEKEGGYVSYTYNLKQSLKNNFGIVVASNNNAAVENISKELPQKKGIDKDRFPTVDYFAGCSQSLTAEENWGAIAAALGNMKNRDSFRKAFWKSEESDEQLGFYNLLYDIYKDPTHDKTHIYQGSFIKHNKLFKSLVKELDDFKKLASSFHKLLPKYIQNKEKEIHLKNDLAKIIEHLSELSIEKTNLQKQENVTKQDADRVQDLLKLHLQQKPSFFFFQRLFSTASYQQWLSKTKSYGIKLQSLDTSLDNLRKKLDLNKNRSEELSTQKEIINKKLSKLNTFFAEYRKSQEILIQEYEIDPKNIVDVDFWQKELNEIHLLNPYHSPKIATLRSKIFITALELHKDAILVNAKEIRNNLSAFFEMLSGWVTVREDMYQNLWDTFFLCVPVVSTTLASASSLFKNIDRNQIGWLLIDEAGQATPQAAVGLIHRSKRCVIVGDPLQIEPVVTIPEKLVTRLRNECKVETEWSPCKVSVQQLADRVSLWGTYMQVGNSEEKVWTGFPLRAHRRCEDPMFTIANKIAYGNQMVNAVHEISNKEFIGPSAWFHVECSSSPYNKHVILEEIELLKTKIKELQKHYSGKIYVISPFKSVSDYCKEVFETQKTISCGTIHTFQGKEADVVFFVLGSNPATAGARNWASQKPNMLNVALTRAKKRFYVIGNKNLWASCNYFNTMAHIIS